MVRSIAELWCHDTRTRGRRQTYLDAAMRHITALWRHDNELAADGTTTVKALDLCALAAASALLVLVLDGRVARVFEDDLALEDVGEPAGAAWHLLRECPVRRWPIICGRIYVFGMFWAVCDLFEAA